MTLKADPYSDRSDFTRIVNAALEVSEEAAKSLLNHNAITMKQYLARV